MQSRSLCVVKLNVYSKSALDCCVHTIYNLRGFLPLCSPGCVLQGSSGERVLVSFQTPPVSQGRGTTASQECLVCLLQTDVFSVTTFINIPILMHLCMYSLYQECGSIRFCCPERCCLCLQFSLSAPRIYQPFRPLAVFTHTLCKIK